MTYTQPLAIVSVHPLLAMMEMIVPMIGARMVIVGIRRLTVTMEITAPTITA
jgi:hypothetical protein